MILVFSLISLILLEKYFERYIASHRAPEVIDTVQQTFAKLLLDDEIVEPPPATEAPVLPEGITSPADWIPVVEGGSLEGAPGAPGPRLATTAETMLPSAEAVGSEARAAAEVRAGRRVARAERVRELGLFFIIGSGGSGAMDYEAMERLYNASAENVGQLGEVLSKLDGLSIPQYGAKGSRGGRVSTTMSDFRGVRTDRPEDQIAALVSDVEPLAEVIETPVERNQEFEEIESTIEAKPSDEELVGLTRSAENVSRVILSHQSAIQDCYKSVLKDNQQVRGEVTVRFWVNFEGRVVDAVILDSTVNNQELEECVLRRMRRWNDFGYADPAKGNAVYRQSYQFGY